MTCRHSLPGGVSNCRILGLVLSPRFGGEVVIDGFGIAPVPMTPEEARDPARSTSFRVLNFRSVRDSPSRRRFLERHLVRCARQYRPTLAVIGTPTNPSNIFRASLRVARKALESRGVQVIEGSLVRARQLLLGHVRGKTRDGLSQSLTTNFFPELTTRWCGKQKRRYERHAWNALALAVVALAEHRPVSALALAQPKAVFPTGFSTLLAHAADNL